MTSLIRCCFRISIGRSHHYLLKLTIIFQNPCEFLCIVRKLVFEGYSKYTFLPFHYFFYHLNPKSLSSRWVSSHRVGILYFCVSVLWVFTIYVWLHLRMTFYTMKKLLFHSIHLLHINPLMLSFKMLIFSCMQYAVDNLILFSLKNISHYNVFRLFLLIIPLEILLFSPCLSGIKAFSNC